MNMSCFVLGETRKIVCFQILSAEVHLPAAVTEAVQALLKPAISVVSSARSPWTGKRTWEPLALGLRHSLGDFEIPVFVLGTASVFYPM